MKVLLLALTLLLAGCSTTVPVTQKWPEAPGLQSQQPCGELQALPNNPTLSQVAQVINQNYTQYYGCVVKLEAWQEWYAKQELIHKGLK
jgi:PBP1b-binding outer membrane lipoprotein LpoB